MHSLMRARARTRARTHARRLGLAVPENPADTKASLLQGKRILLPRTRALTRTHSHDPTRAHGWICGQMWCGAAMTPSVLQSTSLRARPG